MKSVLATVYYSMFLLSALKCLLHRVPIVYWKHNSPQYISISQISFKKSITDKKQIFIRKQNHSNILHRSPQHPLTGSPNEFYNPVGQLWFAYTTHGFCIDTGTWVTTKCQATEWKLGVRNRHHIPLKIIFGFKKKSFVWISHFICLNFIQQFITNSGYLRILHRT